MAKFSTKKHNSTTQKNKATPFFKKNSASKKASKRLPKINRNKNYVSSKHLDQIILTQFQLLQANFNLVDFMNLVVEQMQKLTPATGVVIELIEGSDMVYRAASGTVKDFVGLRLPIKNSLSGLCILTEDVLRSDDTENDPRVNREACRKVQARSLIVAPLFYQGNAVGVLKIVSKKVCAFDEIDIQTLQLMAGLIASGIAHKLFYEELMLKNNKLQEAEERFRLLIESSQDYAIFMLDPQGAIKTWNIGAAHLLGFSETEALGRQFEVMFLPQEVTQQKPFTFMQVAKVKGRCEGEGLYLKKNSETFWANMTMTALYDANHQFVGFAVILRDLTESKKVEAMQNEFISIVSHELRTPLTSIRGALKLLTSGSFGEFSEKIIGLLEIAAKNSERLSNLINDILDIQKLDAGKMQFNIKTWNLIELIRESIQVNEMYAKEWSVQISADLLATDLMVNVDQDRFLQIMANLISNAVKYSNKNGQVTVQVAKRDGAARIAVIDNGPGIPKEFQPLVFQKFSQANKSSTREHPGTGLGLNITKALVEKFGGKINFNTSEKGTTFYFDLPLIK